MGVSYYPIILLVWAALDRMKVPLVLRTAQKFVLLSYWFRELLIGQSSIGSEGPPKIFSIIILISGPHDKMKSNNPAWERLPYHPIILLVSEIF